MLSVSMGKGLNCARDLKLNRKQNLKSISSPYLNKRYICQGSVIKKFTIGAKQPNSGKRKCIKVELKKEKTMISAFVPLCGTIDRIKIHDSVTIRVAGGRKGRSKGDLSGISYEVIKINGVCVRALFNGKR